MTAQVTTVLLRCNGTKSNENPPVKVMFIGPFFPMLAIFEIQLYRNKPVKLNGPSTSVMERFNYVGI